jgi:hypothetical protein
MPDASRPDTMPTSTRDGADSAAGPGGRLRRWLLHGQLSRQSPSHGQGPHVADGDRHKAHPWWRVMCLTGVDYFSTLGYQPGIAAVAAGALSPVATLVLVLVTLAGALPVYARVARESPRGEGSIALLEHLLRWWQGKLFVLALLGFVATDFVITITLSAADAAAHVLENPFAPAFLHGHQVAVTLALVGLLGGVFLRGFREAIGIAVTLVAAYLALNAVVLGAGLYHLAAGRAVGGFLRPVPDWWAALPGEHGGSALRAVGVALILFPKLALGLSGFETGVALMPLVKGRAGDTDARPDGRVRNTRRLLVGAALIMSVYLLASSLVTTLLIPPAAFAAAAGDRPAGPANGRALAYLAHAMLGPAFGTAYDASTVLILWFAGASAMAGLLNVVPRYLPRYGMAPEWARAARPLVLVYTAVAVVVTLAFRADVDAQGGAYATGVLVLMTSAAFAVALSARRRRARAAAVGFGLIVLAFAYTTAVNVWERPEGVKIAAVFIAAIVAVSLASRLWRTLELRVTKIELDEPARRFVDEAAAAGGELRLIANHPEACDRVEYDREEREAREDHDIPPGEPLLFLEVYVSDASEFDSELRVSGVEVGGHRVLRARGTAVPNAIAALLLHLRDATGRRPHAYFNWTEGNPLLYLVRYVLSGRGDIAPVTREILRREEKDRDRRPVVHAAI